MAQALYRKWRPYRWDQVIGQDHIIQTLRNAVVAERVAHAYLFAGPRGTGKTTTARLLAKAVNCLETDLSLRPCDQCEYCLAVNQGRFLDLIEIDAASNTSVDDVRDLRDKINFSPNQGRFKVYIIDEVHMLSTAAFNALLKTLEEPPAHAIFVLATTEIHKIPATVLSRCQRYEFRRIPVNDIVSLLNEIAASEGIQAEEQALTLVARQATGSMRDAISLLDQLASTEHKITLAQAQTVLGTAANQSVIDIIEAVANGDTTVGLDSLHKTLDAGSDPRQFARQIVDYLRDLLLVRMQGADQIDTTAEVRAHMARHAHSFSVAELLRIIRVFNQAANEARSAWQPALPLEMAFVEALQGEHLEKAETTTPPTPSRESKPEPALASQPEAVQETPAQDETLDDKQQDLPAPPGGVDLRTISASWRQVLSIVRKENLHTEALINSGKLLGVKDGVLYLGLSEVLKSKMEKGQNLEIFQNALAKALQVDVPVRCVVSAGKGGSIPPDLESDGMVAAALRDLGGEIVDIQ